MSLDHTEYLVNFLFKFNCNHSDILQFMQDMNTINHVDLLRLCEFFSENLYIADNGVSFIDQFTEGYAGKFDTEDEFIKYVHSYLIEHMQSLLYPFNDERVIDWEYLTKTYKRNPSFDEYENHYFVC